MLHRTIVHENFSDFEAVAVIFDHVLDDFMFSLPKCEPIPGAVYYGILERKLKGQGAWIVKLPCQFRGYLKSSRLLEEGSRIVVQISGYSDKGKLVPLTEKIERYGFYTIVTGSREKTKVSRKIQETNRNDNLVQAAMNTIQKFDGLGVVIRSSAVSSDEASIAEEVQQLGEDFQKINISSNDEPKQLLKAPPVLTRSFSSWGMFPHVIDNNEGSFDRHGVWDLLDEYRRPEFILPNGGNIVIETTQALTAVDVNSGKDLSQNSGLKTNLAAAKVLPRQLRVRGTGGQIIIDFAPVSKNARHKIKLELKSAFQADPVKSSILDWTRLGHFEINRHRDRLPLNRLPFA